MANASQFQVLGNGDGDERWVPRIGEEVNATLGRTLGDEDSRQLVLTTSCEILSQCASPDADEGNGTGLVVGYVQSGKTLSFTTVAALANDNRYGIIIVIAGMTRDLSKQSYERLLRDLGVEDTPFSRWAEFFEPKIDDVPRMRDILADAKDESVPVDDRKTILITLKKNHARLRSLNSTLRELGTAVAVPTLIIDDEADQASLNNLVRNGELSTTYRQMRQLRDLLPKHTFLQYTATPQAPLLINLIDVLSPDFPVVVEPGPDYVGGATFFENGSPYIEDIPPNDIPTANQPLQEPPESLVRTLQLFFIGVASGYKRRDGRPRNRSMMVHPSRETIGHVQYHTWVQAIRRLWIDTLDLPERDPARLELIDCFRDAYEDIAGTVGDLEPFEDILAVLLQSIRDTDVRLVNSLAQANREIHWRRHYSWILVGGQVLDRGFTVEGLTITYMPRGPGVGNADTIQQRARFLGYKRQYLGFCRVFLEPTVSTSYRRYIHHEEDVRNRLVEHIQSGQPLSAFRRAFLLDRALRPTRQSVIDIDFTRPSFPRGWCTPKSPHDSDLDSNRNVINAFVEEHAAAFGPDDGHANRQDHQRHLVAKDLALGNVYEQLLTLLSLRDFEDSQSWTAALILIDRFLTDNQDATCAVYRMRPNVTTRRQVRDGKIINLFQGAYPDARGQVYPGDRQLRSEPMAIQLHTVTLREGSNADSPLIADDVMFAALWMSPAILRDIVVQPQGGD